MRIGIHTGLVVVGEMGGGDYPDPMAIVGETPNIAARLQTIAEPNTVVISEATARNHLTSILDKLALSNRFQLAVYAFRRGLVPCPQTPAFLRSTDASRQDIYPRPRRGGSSRRRSA